MRILLVEDNSSLSRGICNALEDQGHAVDVAHDGESGDALLQFENYDLALIDINLPLKSGLELVSALRRRGSSLPVLMLTARSKVSDRIAGLDAGADDYLVKPFDLNEMFARIRALIRRQPTLQPPVETIGMLSYDRSARTLFAGKTAIDLPRRELALFEALLIGRGRIISKEQIADRVYGSGAAVDLNAVELLISRLRRRLSDYGVVIRTARGLGYMMDAGNLE